MRKKKDEIFEALVFEEKETKQADSNKKTEIVEKDVFKVSSKDQKPYFFTRLVAYILDVVLVSIVCAGILYFLPENKNYDKYMKEYETIQTQYMEQELTTEEYVNKAMDVVYDIDYSNVLSMIVQVVLIILYFIVFQFYNKGQTFGKKLMKLRVVSTNDEPITLNQIAIRALIINSIFVNILIIGSIIFIGRDYYYYANSVIQGISMVLTLVTLIMILFRKDGKGLHDVIARTQVIHEEV